MYIFFTVGSTVHTSQQFFKGDFLLQYAGDLRTVTKNEYDVANATDHSFYVMHGGTYYW